MIWLSSANAAFRPNWDILKSLRSRFLNKHFSSSSYWDNDEVLFQYDETFGKRISWKWLSVFDAAKKSVSFPHKINLFDWGCGTAVASRTFLQFWGENRIESVLLYDKSQRAKEFARHALKKDFPNIDVVFLNGQTPTEKPYVLLLSHVLNELSNQDKTSLSEALKKAQMIFWVEPGTPEISQELIQFRELFKEQFFFLLPCTHQEICGLYKKNSSDWCHFFAKPPVQVFQDPFWSEFSKKLGIDLRSLPLSFWVGLSRSSSYFSPPEKEPQERQRVLGRARHYKGYSSALVCNSRGVKQEKILQRNNIQTIDILKKNPFLFEFYCSES